MQDKSDGPALSASHPAEIRRFLLTLYRALLQREPDSEGLASWTANIVNGMSYAEVLERFVASPEYAMRQQGTPDAVKMFVPPGHFYSPIVDIPEAARHMAKVDARRSATFDLPNLRIDLQSLLEKWNDLVPLMKSAPFTANAQAGLRYRFENPSYSWGDGSVLHGMLRLHRPKRLIEIGSGHSSACTLDTIERYLGGNCEVTFIEPYPELLLSLIGDAASQVRILRHGVQDAPVEMFSSLTEGDILFIDSTHVLRTGSDVCFELFEILPRLAKGVLVHFHDMFWPFEYPHDWVIAENRSWNEIYALRAYLTNNDSWKVIMFNDYLALLARPLIEATYPQFLRNSGGALWLQRQ